MKTLYICLLSIVFSISVSAQRHIEKELFEFKNPNEIVTLSEAISFNKAIEVLSKVSLKNTGKNIVSTANINAPIGVKIEKMNYYKALLLISKYNGLKVEEKENVIVVSKVKDVTAGLSPDIYAPISEREVKISAVIFEADVSEMRQAGINWSALLTSPTGGQVASDLRLFTKVDPNAQQGGTGGSAGGGNTGNTQQQDLFDYTLGAKNTFQIGDWTGDIEAMFRFFENNDWGEVISRPNVTVRNNVKGRIQIGSDISIKQRDFAGNVIDNFISTGSIIEVTPHIYSEDGIDYVLLDLSIERSSGTPGVVSTEIKKIQAQTQTLMLNGEETIIGGLYINQENEVRRGIPILKDLPWWVFGIRYLTGYTETQIIKKEVIILLETTILPTLKERIAIKKESLVREQLLKDESEAHKYKVKDLIEELKKKKENEEIKD